MRQRTPTDRELQALIAVAQPGSSMLRAAHDLDVSYPALQKRLRSLYRRLEVDSSTQALYKIRDQLP